MLYLPIEIDNDKQEKSYVNSKATVMKTILNATKGKLDKLRKKKDFSIHSDADLYCEEGSEYELFGVHQLRTKTSQRRELKLLAEV